MDAGINTAVCSDPTSPGHLLKLLLWSSVMVEGVGKGLTLRPSHPTQLESLDSSYPSSGIALVHPSPVLPRHHARPPFPKHLHPSSPTYSLVRACTFSNFCLLICTCTSFKLPTLNPYDSRHKDLYPTHLPVPVLYHVQIFFFSTDSHSFIISYFEQFVKYNISIHTIQY